MTKHIKLKKERDPTHEGAEMQMIDVETGRRNYTKYNRFLTTMRVHEPQLDSPAANSTLPHLTPAPSINASDFDKNGAAMSSKRMPPLPTLHPADSTMSSLKRAYEGGGNGDSDEVPRKKLASEKKIWKCKKCKFRYLSRLMFDVR